MVCSSTPGALLVLLPAPLLRYPSIDKNSIKALTKADKRKVRHGAESFGHCEFRSSTETCYAVGPKIDRQSEPECRTNIFDAPRPGPMPRPTFNIKLPSIKEMMSSKINDLPHRHRSKFTDILAAYDSEVDKSCVAIKDASTKLL